MDRPNPRGYGHQPINTHLNLVDMGARLYDRQNGRFLQPDPVIDPSQPDSLGGYTYAAVAPVNHTDWTGLMTLASEGGGAGHVATSRTDNRCRFSKSSARLTAGSWRSSLTLVSGLPMEAIASRTFAGVIVNGRPPQPEQHGATTVVGSATAPWTTRLRAMLARGRARPPAPVTLRVRTRPGTSGPSVSRVPGPGGSR